MNKVVRVHHNPDWSNLQNEAVCDPTYKMKQSVIQIIQNG